VITTTHRLTRAATARNPLVRTLRNLGFRAAGHVPPIRRAFAMNLSELAIAPRGRSGALRRGEQDGQGEAVGGGDGR